MPAAAASRAAMAGSLTGIGWPEGTRHPPAGRYCAPRPGKVAALARQALPFTGRRWRDPGCLNMALPCLPARPGKLPVRALTMPACGVLAVCWRCHRRSSACDDLRPVQWRRPVNLVVTVVWHDWIEAVSRVAPDRGNGSAEWLVVAVLAAVTFALIAGARYEWRRARLVT